MFKQFSKVLLSVSVLAFLALVLGVGQTAHAAIIAYEGFDYDQPVGTSLNGLNGGVGWAANAWATATVPVNTTGMLAAGLTFSDYPVSGKAGVVSMSGSKGGPLIGPSRRFGSAVKAGDTLWISFLFMRNTRDLVVWGANTVRTGTAPTGGKIQLDIQTRALADHDTGAAAPSPSAIDGAKSPLWPNTSGTTYLCVVEVTNRGGAGTETLWILSAANYDAIKAGGITRAKLVANNIATATKASSDITLDASKYLQLGCHHWHEGTSYLTVDEIKFATTLTEVLSPVRPGTAAPADVKPAAPPQPVKPAPAVAGTAPKTVTPTSDLTGSPMPPDFKYAAPSGFHTNLSFVGGKAGWRMDAEGLHGSREISSFHKSWETASDFEYGADIRIVDSVSAGGSTLASLAFRAGRFYGQTCLAGITTDGGGKVFLARAPDFFAIGDFKAPIALNTTHHLMVRAIGPHIQVFLDHGAVPVIDVQDKTFSAGFFATHILKTHAVFQNVRYRSLSKDANTASLKAEPAATFTAPAPVNLVLNKPTVPADMKVLVDGKPLSGTIMGTIGGSFYVDLGAAQTAGRIIVTPTAGHCNCADYSLSASDDAKTWTVVWKTDSAKKHDCGYFHPVEAIFPPVTARYYKFDFIGGTWGTVQENEVELFAPGTSTANLALGKPAVQSNQPNAAAATDGDYTTATAQPPAQASWLTVGLGQNTLIDPGPITATTALWWAGGSTSTRRTRTCFTSPRWTTTAP